MSFLHDKASRYFFLFLILCCLFSGIISMGITFQQGETAKKLLLDQTTAAATSLLEQNVAPHIIATALTNNDVSAQGEAFVSKIGLTYDMDIQYLPLASDLQKRLGRSLLLGALILSILLCSGAMLFLLSRERLYLEADEIVLHYLEGVHTKHLPRHLEGNLYRLFSSIEELANALYAKNEAEHQSGVFLKNLISDISHQLKTPLAALKMYNEIISDEPTNIQVVTEFTAKSQTALNRIESLIGAMLKMARLDVGSIPFHRKAYSVTELIDSATESLKTRAGLEEKQLILEGKPETIYCDLPWTSEALSNLVKNALDHTDKGGHITISWERTPLMFRLTVADDGQGIDPQDYHHIFKRFYRSHNILNTQGIGLGLPLAKSIVEGQGGFLTVKSEPGMGTSFTMSFLTEL